jgi:hypothetical protein
MHVARTNCALQQTLRRRHAQRQEGGERVVRSLRREVEGALNEIIEDELSSRAGLTTSRV